jgi:hypothetical protein
LGAPDLDPANPSTFLSAYRAVAARHQAAALADNFVLLRQMVFTTNVGLVDVEKNGDEYTVHHTLLSRSKHEPYKGIKNTVHTMSLSPTTETKPELQIGS